MSIRVENVSKEFGAQKALNAISFEAQRGEITGFLGPNGAGKSTTMKLITGVYQLTTGTIYLNDKNLADTNIQDKGLIGYLAENNPLYDDMYVLEYLKFVASLYQLSDVKNKVEEVIQLTGLEPQRTKKIQELSKGYKQRVGIAQAIIHNPEIIILDEPTSGLDPNQIIEIRDLIKTLAKDKTVLFSSHIMTEVEELCDKVVIINKGEVVAQDRIENLKRRVSDDITLCCSFESSYDFELLRTFDEVLDITVISDNEIEITTKDVGFRKKLMVFIANQEWQLTSIADRGNSLEDVFKNLTGS